MHGVTAGSWFTSRVQICDMPVMSARPLHLRYVTAPAADALILSVARWLPESLWKRSGLLRIPSQKTWRRACGIQRVLRQVVKEMDNNIQNQHYLLAREEGYTALGVIYDEQKELGKYAG